MPSPSLAQSGYSYQSFETSVTIIQRANWKIKDPQIDEIANEASAIRFLKTPLVRDKRQNLDENRFRLLFVRLRDRSELRNQKALLEAAKASGWINAEFLGFVDKGTVGSALIRGEQNISIMMQTPGDDMPFITFSMAEFQAVGRQKGIDWVCLLFAAFEIDLKLFLGEESFPSDYSSQCHDYMFLPTYILKWQVEHVRDGLMTLMQQVLEEERAVIFEDTQTLKGAKGRLFDLGKKHLELRNRWLFGKELALNLTKSFDEIVMSRSSSISKISYSKTLRQRVDTQLTLSEMLKTDLDTIPSKIKAQHQMIDAELSIMIARYSYIAADKARRDSSSMKTIATLTLLFLPATTVASIFSMTMFNWTATNEEAVVSDRIWWYFVIAIPLTLIVLGIWILWYRWTQKKNSKRTEEDVELALISDPK